MKTLQEVKEEVAPIKKKSFMKELLIITMPTIMVYLFLSFIFWNLNPACWSEEQRISFVFLSVISTIITVTVPKSLD